MLIFADMNDSISSISTISHMASMPTLAAMSPIVVNLLIGLFLVVCITMILLVLIQRPQGGGLSGAFGSGGGGGAGQTAFGTKTGDVLTWATIGIFVTFLGLAILLNFETRPPKRSSVESIITAPVDTGAGATESEETTDLSSTLEGLNEESGDGASEGIDAGATQDAVDPTAEDE